MSDKLKSRKKFLYTSLEILVVLIMTMVGNMWDWVNMEFKPELIATSHFWEDTIVKATLYSGSLILAMLLKLSKLELNDLRYEDLLKVYRDEKLPIKDKNPEAFDEYLEKTLNPKIKKEYIRSKLERKLYKIQRYERDAWAMDYFQAKDTEEYENYNFSSKWSKRYFIKRTRIEKMLDKDFIEKHWMNMSVKCPRISSAQFGKYLEIGRNDDNKYKLINKIVGFILKQGSLKIITVFFISICLTIMALSPQTNELLEQANGWIVLLIQYIIRVIMICLSFATGIWTAKTGFDDNYLLPITNRITILEEFDVYRKNHPTLTEIEKEHQKAVEEAKKEFDKEVDRQVNIRLTEEINRLKKDLDRVQ